MATLLHLLPETQVALAVSIFLATFVYEDGATLLAATLSASGRLHPALGLAAAFGGIWVGDIGLFLVGSRFRAYAVISNRFGKFLKADAIARAQAWFARHGSYALVMSRAIPGSRLPLYLAAGVLRLSLRRFAQITGICAAIWVSIIFAVWQIEPTARAGSGNRLRWILSAIALSAPWIVLKSRTWHIRRRDATPTIPQTGSLKPCAL
jgi:membrane protein DedA with SNARE-associated domain